MSLKTSLSLHKLAQYVEDQLRSLFPDGSPYGSELRDLVEEAIRRVDFSFSNIRLKYYSDGKDVFFNHLHTDQYAAFLYFLSNTAYRHGSIAVASKTYALNKVLHGIDVFYEVELPDIFLLQHPVGTVLGRARYANYLVVYQRCSVGSNLEHVYPTIEEGVVLFGGSAIIGNSAIRRNVWLSVNTVIMDQDVPPNSIVFGRSPALVVKTSKRDVIEYFFNRSSS